MGDNGKEEEIDIDIQNCKYSEGEELEDSEEKRKSTVIPLETYQ